MNTLHVTHLKKIKSFYKQALELEIDNFNYLEENREKMYYQNVTK